MSLRYIEPDAPAFADAVDLRYATMYAEWGLSRSLVDDPDPEEYLHLVTEEDGRVVGYSRIRLVNGDAKILQVCVGEADRGRGIATAMMIELMRIARTHGRPEVYVDAREHVISYYAGLGFVGEGEVFLSPRTGTPHRVMRYVFG